MDQIAFIDIKFWAIIFINCVLIVYLIWLKHKNITITSDEYLTNLKILQITGEMYRDTFIIPRLTKLEKQYDLNPKSDVNAINSFNAKKQEFIKDAISVIITSYLSKSVIRSLLKYHTIQGISLMLLNVLEGRE